MMGNKFVVLLVAIGVVGGASYFAPVAAAENGPADAVVGEASSPSPKSPIKVKVVDYAKDGEDAGTLKLSGTAIANSTVYIYVDAKPLGQVVADGDGAWHVEDKIPLDDSVHSVRVEQFDKETNMLAGRAMFSISLSKPTPEDLAAPPVGRP